MKLSITGKQIDVGSSLRSYVEENLKNTILKFFETPLNANVAICKEGSGIRVDVSVHPMGGLLIQSSSSSPDAYAAFDSANEKITRQLRRYKKRLTEHKGKGEMVSLSVIEPEKHEHDDALPQEESAPMIIAEMQAELPLCTVSGAVMRMDLADLPAMLFRNVAHGGLNMVYRRPDGNIGWVDPQGS